MLRGQELREFDELQSQHVGATNNYLKLIQEGLLEYFFPINAISKKKRAMRRVMRKHWSTSFKSFAARLTKSKNFLSILPGSEAYNKMEMEDINEILLHTVSNVWYNQSYLQGWYFELKTYRETCAMFERMGVTEKVYKGATPSKIPTRADVNQANYFRKRKGG